YICTRNQGNVLKKTENKKRQKKICDKRKKDSIFAVPTCKGKGNIANQPLEQRQRKKRIKFFSKPLPVKKEVVVLHPLTTATLKLSKQ
ncbi:hypothetical protein GWA97_13740, partial [Flavobacterium sp. LaA7.5]|nr:hypothetical protein [Flavobacterium salilacus subsp. altitudinum]